MDDDHYRSSDHRVWATAFVRQVRTNPAIATDPDTMGMWFASAIMRGYDDAQQRLDDVNAKDSIKTREINILTRENRCLSVNLTDLTQSVMGIVRDIDETIDYAVSAIHAEDVQMWASQLRTAVNASLYETPPAMGDGVGALEATPKPSPCPSTSLPERGSLGLSDAAFKEQKARSVPIFSSAPLRSQLAVCELCGAPAGVTHLFGCPEHR